MQFANQPGATFVLVGVVSRLRLRPRSLVGGFLYTYLLSSAGDRMDFVHRTPVEEVRTAHKHAHHVYAGRARHLRLPWPCACRRRPILAYL